MSTRSSPTAATILCTCLAWSAETAEEGLLGVRSLSARIEALPTAFTYDLTAADGLNTSGKDDFDLHFSAAIGLRPTGARSPFQLGAELAMARAVGAGVGFQTVEARLVGGACWVLGQDVSIHMECAAGGGFAGMQLETGNREVYGSIISLTPEVSASWRWDAERQTTVAVGWRVASAVMDSADLDVELRQSGVMVAVGMVWTN